MADSRTTYNTEDLLPIGEAARVAGVSVETVRNWTRRGLLREERTPGGHRRIRRGDIERLLARSAS